MTERRQSPLSDDAVRKTVAMLTEGTQDLVSEEQEEAEEAVEQTTLPRPRARSTDAALGKLLIVPNLKMNAPPEVADLDRTPENAREILVAYALDALEVLRGIARGMNVPIRLRKEAASDLATIGSAVLPKRTEKFSQSISRVEVERVSASIDRLPTNILEQLLDMQSLPQAPAVALPMPPQVAPLVETPTGVLPPEPAQIFLPQEKRPLGRPPAPLEARIIRFLTKHKTVRGTRLKKAMAGDGFKPAVGLDEILADLTRRGVIELVPIGKQGGLWYRIASRSARQDA